MLELNAPEWQTMDGGYRQPYDASVILRSLETSAVPPSKFWDAVWNNLYHQQDVGLASYAALPWILKIYREKGWIDHELPNYAFALEQARLMGHNPPLPEDWNGEYQSSLEEVMRYCLQRRYEYSEPNFRKAVVLLAAVLVGAKDLAELIDFVELGDELKALELYQCH